MAHLTRPASTRSWFARCHLSAYWVLPAALLSGTAALAAANRPVAAGNFALVLDGVQAGFLKSVDGGGVTAAVLSEAAGASAVVGKHLGNIKYEDWVVQVGLGSSSQIQSWVAASWSGKAPRHSGSLVECNYDLNAVNQYEFQSAFITETIFPTLEAEASKDSVSLTVRFAPEVTRKTAASGKCGGAATKDAKTWVASNFRLELDGVDTTGVSKIASFSIKQGGSSDEIGSKRDFEKTPGKPEFPNLKITISASKAQAFENWFNDFVIKGNAGAEKEKNGAIVFLSPNLQEELGRVALSNVGIFRLTRNKFEANTEKLSTMTAELYVESMSLQIGKALRTKAAAARKAPAKAVKR